MSNRPWDRDEALVWPGGRLGLEVEVSVQCPKCGEPMTDSFHGLKLAKASELWLYCEADGCGTELDANVTIRRES